MDIGADVNFGENRETPLCVAVQSRNKKMVGCLLEHNIPNVNVREALKLSWELNLDSITGVLLEHIAVDRSRESVDLSGLELTTLKPLWLLPSLGIHTLPKEREQYRRHRKQRSLGHVKEFLSNRRKSIATEVPFELSLMESCKSDSRRLSVDLSSLKYVSDAESVSEIEEVDFGSTRANLEDIQESAAQFSMNCAPKLIPIVDPVAHSSLGRQHSEGLKQPFYAEDSEVDTTNTVHRQPSSESGLSDSLAEAQVGVMSRGTLRRQRHGTVSGAATLPHCTLEQFSVDKKEEDSSVSTLNSVHSVYADGDSTLSPAQLIRKYRKRNKKSGRQTLNESFGSSFSFRADSPIPVMYCADQQDGLQESIAMFSPNTTSRMYNSSREGGSLVASPSDLSSSSSKLSTSASSSARDDVDFSGYDPIPEESSFSEQSSSHLIKVLDLSSNRLHNFHDLCCDAYGGEFVFKRLKNVSSFDLKQNRLSELVKPMMKVGFLGQMHAL